MVASSVTGLTNNGAGSADGKNKGSEHMSLGVENLIGVRVVAAGAATLATGAATVTFPQPLEGDKGNYVVMLTNATAAQLAYISATTNNGGGNFISFAIAGNTTNVINWIVVKFK